MPHKLSIILVSFNTCDLLRERLAELSSEHEVVVVDNASADGSAEMVAREFPGVVLLRNRKNRGFATAVNQAYDESSGSYLLLLNPDAQPVEGALERMVDFMDDHSECGVVSGRIYDGEGREQVPGRKFPTLWQKFRLMSGMESRSPTYRFTDSTTGKEVDWAPGAMLMVRRRMIEEIGFFDERFFLYYEEVDLCRRAKKVGWRVYAIPDAAGRHTGGESARAADSGHFEEGGRQLLRYRIASERVYLRKWKGLGAVLLYNGFELAWHLLRALKNLFSVKKRDESLRVVRALLNFPY